MPLSFPPAPAPPSLTPFALFAPVVVAVVRQVFCLLSFLQFFPLIEIEFPSLLFPLVVCVSGRGRGRRPVAGQLANALVF